MALDPNKYVPDPVDGLPCEVVGPWAEEKHKRLTKYIDISRGVRSQFLTGNSKEATFLDFFSGPGRCNIRGTNTFVDGGCIGGWKMGQAGGSPFTKLVVSDLEPSLSAAAETRLRASGAPVAAKVGSAEETVDEIVSTLNPYGLHFAYLDPFKLDSLPFKIIQSLAKLKRMDILAHISLMDFQRNALSYSAEANPEFDRFAPGWRDNVETVANQHTFRANLMTYWRKLVSGLGMEVAKTELVKGPDGQRLYWLAFIARNSKAIEFWDKIRVVDGQRSLL